MLFQVESEELNYKLLLIMRYVILLILIGSCTSPKPLERPFVIVQKTNLTGENRYEYQDKNGTRQYFFSRVEDSKQYNIGDTIK